MKFKNQVPYREIKKKVYLLPEEKGIET